MSPNQACLLPCEDSAEFDELRRGLEDSHQPTNAHERLLVDEFANAAWELQRMRRIDKEFWGYIGTHYAPGEAGIAQAIAQEKEAKFRIHLRLRAQAERSYYRALNALERMHRDRNRRPAQAREQIAVTAPRPHLLVVPPPAPPEDSCPTCKNENYQTNPTNDITSVISNRNRGQDPCYPLDRPADNSSRTCKNENYQTNPTTDPTPAISNHNGGHDPC